MKEDINEVNENNTKYFNFFIKIYPWYSGLVGDLMFYIAIDTLFLTIVKGLSASQIVFLTTIGILICILLQKPILKIINRIGNVSSIRVGTILALFSVILLTFSKQYFILILAEGIREISVVFKNMENIILENNLKYVGKEKKYINVKNRCNLIYAGLTAIIAFIVGFLFNINQYLPMYLSILCCFIGVVISFFIREFEPINKIDKNNNIEKGKFNNIIISILVSYGIFFSCIMKGQENGKLFIQYELAKVYDTAMMASYLGIIVSISRIARVYASLIFNNMYEKLKDKVGLILNFLLLMSFAFMILGYFINISMTLKFTIMAIGYCIILAIRDPYKIYAQDLILKNSNPIMHQELLTDMELTRKIGALVLGLIISAMLLKLKMLVVIIVLFILATIEFRVGIRLYKKLNLK